MKLYCLCKAPDCTRFFSVEVGAYVSKANINEAAANASFRLIGDYFYCDKCETPDQEITRLHTDIIRLEQEKEELNNKRGRAEFERGIYERMYKEQKELVSKLMDKPKKKWWWQK